MLNWLKDKNCPLDPNACTDAAMNGQLDALKWLRANHFEWSEFTCMRAAEGGHFEVLKWARDNGCEAGSNTCLRAAKHFEMLKYLLEIDCPCNDQLCNNAIAYGNLESLQYAVSKGFPLLSNSFVLAIHKGNLRIVKWLIHQAKHQNYSELMEIAARRGQLDIFVFLDTLNPFWNREFCFENAIKSGEVELLNWIVEHGAQVPENAMDSAPNLKIAMFLYQRKNKITAKAMASVAHAGDLKALKWMKENGGKWNDDIMAFGALSGSLEVVKWLHKQGCKWDQNIVIDALWREFDDIVEYFETHSSQ